ncbi:glycosyl hydrolase [Arthrobacter sp. MSA 4-2]|uniref:glycoside hydrolase family 76 protein n=1 Tax=Arthrobacter sp. MSA 4-2 TaxID=2794349 RepID=UPI0018E742C3|nr:glycoside hydrolase family 76 protein [Arthrobacter sp. MSA 4-2]MBJ2120825.1 glycosyl hydrolase [Arthrobacter sp. MSA 4-2]
MLTPPDSAGPDTPASRAQAAAESVETLFAARALGLPGTRLGRIAFPRPRGRGLAWHYWWQAHYLDALLDGHLRLRTVDPAGADAALRRAVRLARGIRLRNGARWTNSYFDDMAWLALALQRLDGCLTDAGRRPRHRRARAALEAALRSAATPEFGGGVYWNTRRNFKNTPATAPAALYFARAGDREQAAGLLAWLHRRLWDAESGLYLDGIQRTADGEKLRRAVYTYNQGPVLGALTSLGGGHNLRQAESLIAAVQARLTTPEGSLRTHGSGDGGLFTGILARYLTEAALAPGLAADAAGKARSLVEATAAALWEGRRSHGGALIFPSAPGTTAAPPVDLSTQLQALLVFEAEARIDRQAVVSRTCRGAVDGENNYVTRT